MREITNRQVLNTMRTYIRNNAVYTFSKQNETLILQSPWGDISTRHKHYRIQDLNFISRVRREIIKDETYLPWAGKVLPKPVYNKYADLKMGEVFNDVVNIDISSAYWETAWKLGLLREETYLAGNEPAQYEERTGKKGTYKVVVGGMTKQVRLAAIGSLAKKVLTYTYDGINQPVKEIKHQEHTEILWDAICCHVGDLLVKVAKACGPDFIFFWVDGIYIKRSSAKVVEKMFKQAGYQYKINPLKKIEVHYDKAADIASLRIYTPEPEKIMVDGVETLKYYKKFAYRRQGPKSHKKASRPKVIRKREAQA